MPTYRYRCNDCGTEFDQYQKFSDDPLTECPSCAGRIRRVIQPVGVVFKGSGWYVTDSRPAAAANVSEKSSEKAEKPQLGDKSETPVSAEGGKATTPAKSAEAPASSEKPKAKDSKVAAGA